ncbi:MAG: hypothetical protein RR547_13900 [Raoultibacter sp.]
MDRDEKYSFISVNAGDDDEIVIQTGAVQASREEQADTLSALDQHVDDADNVVENSEQSDGFDDDPELEPEPDVAQTLPDPVGSVSSKEYETTREDLDSVGPMSKMQKIVIACALLFVLGFAAYYIFLR